MEKNNQNLLQKLTQILNVDKIISPEDIEAIRDALIGVLANNKKELESLTDETKQAVNSILDKVLNEHDTYLEKTKQIAQEAKSETTEAINSTLKSLEEVKALCKEVMECKPENGEDADEEYVIGEVLNRIKLPEYKEIVLDDGGAIVDKINSLPVNEENQIDAKHIKNLPEGKGGRVISGGVTRKIVEQMIEAAGGGGGSQTLQQVLDTGNTATESGSGNTMELDHSGSGDTLVLNHSGSGDALQVNGKAVITGNLTVDTDTLFVDATNNRVAVGSSTPSTVSGKLLVYENTTGTSTATGLIIEQAGTGDAKMDFLITGTRRWIMGVDNSNGDGFGISSSTGLGSADRLFIDVNGLIGMGTSAPTHTLTLPSTSTGIALYNTADQTTNYERAQMYWNSNVFTIQAQKGGTGTNRNLKIGTVSRVLDIIDSPTGTDGFYTFNNSTGTTSNALSLKTIRSNGTLVAVEHLINATYNQSGSAGYSLLVANAIENTLGSGTKLLADFQVGGVSKFNVANTGITTITNINDAAASNQVLVLQGDRATPAANDEIYQSFLLSSSTGVQREMGRITVRGTTVTNGSEVGQMKFYTIDGGAVTNKMDMTGVTLRPSSNDILALGTTANSWSDLFLASGGVINWNNGNATLTHSTGLLTSSVPIVAPKRVVTTTDDSTAVIDVAVTDVYQLSAIANNTTFSFTGTPTDGQNFIIRYKDAGVSKTLTWTGFTAIGVTLPTATTAGKWGYVGVTYNSAASQYHVTAVTTEA